MHINRVRNQNGVETVLVRESYREDGKVKKRTVANLTHLPPEAQEAVARALSGEVLVGAAQALDIVRSRQHGNVDAVLTAMRRLKMDRLISPGPGRERSLVLAMIAARILEPDSKLATTRWWETTTLPASLGVEGATENDLYGAMDWLLEQQEAIEGRLAKRHLDPCGLVLYDLTSSYVEGTKCPLAARGYSRDGKPEKLQVNYGLLTDEEGRPISVSVYSGNTSDPRTVQDQVDKLKSKFGIDLMIFVGDRGMLAQTTIESFKRQGNIEWITALKSGAIRRLHAEGSLQMGLFDDRLLFEFQSPLFPGERLVACRNPQLAERRARKRQEMLQATRKELERVQQMVARGTLRGKSDIGVRVGRVINKYKMAKHFKVVIEDDRLTYRTRSDSVRSEAALDGIYVVRTSVPSDVIATEDVVRNYKRLTRTEKTFRGMKMSGLEVRPIFHHAEPRVRSHIFLCMLAMYVQWHMQAALRSVLFAEETDLLPTRDPVKPAKPSEAVQRKKAARVTEDGLPVHSFRSLLRHLSGIVQNDCMPVGSSKTFSLTTRRDQLQEKVFALLGAL